MTRKTLAASLAALTLVLSTGSAFAATAYATQTVNLREGPGTNYDVVGSLDAGDEVELIECGGGWCETDEGFVAASYLATAGGAGDDEEEDEEEDEDEISSFDLDEGAFDEDPLGLEDTVPESIKSDEDD